ncbi:S-layer family protein [Ureibacillus xyleni]|uniref:S-layer family protein n=1 Tax=Ureibacillus xyleni TaxID=614648 RepID=A0A285RAD6_9BACL|nr:Ig-like domain-containing protein [Ureibacillus xyleni]SOB90834.1 S-layer family protein [Ureibacillus xyleni]
MAQYKKFVATAATATLVASAIVPVASAAASFSDVPATSSHAEAIDALVADGIINGYPGGLFKPGNDLSRGNVVKLLGKWVEKQGYSIPADWDINQRFDDLPVTAEAELVKYAALVKDAGVFKGVNNKLNSSDKISRENMALTLDRAYKAVYGKSLVELAEGTEDLAVADLASAKAESRDAIQALRNLGITTQTNFDPKSNVTRGQFASFLYRTIQAETTPAPELTVDELGVKDASTLLVTLSNGTAHEVTLENALVANTDTEVTFQINGVEYKETVKYVVTVKEAKVVDATTLNVTLSNDVKKEIKLEKALEANKATDVKFVIDGAEYTAKVTYVVLNKVSTINAITDTTVTVTLAETPAKELTADQFTVQANGEAVVVSEAAKVASDLTGKTYKLIIASLVGKEGKLTVNTAEKEFDFKAPELTKVDVQGNKTVVLTFNEKLSEASVANIKIYKGASEVQKATTAGTVLSGDGKTVTINLKADSDANKLTVADYKVVLGTSGNEVKDLANNAIYAGTEISFRPTQAQLQAVKAPQAVKASYDNARGKLVVTLDTAASYDVTKLAINNVALTTADNITPVGNELQITLGENSKKAVNALTGALTLNVAKDALVVGEVGSAAHSVKVDTITPAKLVSTTYNEELNILTLNFDQAVKSPNLAGISFGTSDSVKTVLTGATDKEATVTEKATWNFELSAGAITAIESTYSDKTAIKVLLADQAVTNVSDATIKSAQVLYKDAVTVKYVKDEAKPTLSSVSFSSVESAIKFKFNEALSSQSGDIIVDTAETATANRVVINSASLSQDGTDKTLYTVAANGATKTALKNLYNSGKEIKVWFAKDVFTDTNSLKNDALTFATGLKFNYADYDRPVLEVAYDTDSTLGADSKVKVIDNTHIEVKFNEVVTKETAENVSNYVIQGPSAKLQVVSAKLQVDSQTVLLTTAPSVNNVTYDVTVSGVKDTAGNAMSNTEFSYTGTSAVVDTKVEVASVTAFAPKASNDDTLAVEFNLDGNAGLAASAKELANYRVLEAAADTPAAWEAAKEVSLSGAEITVSGNVATIKLANNLSHGKVYKVIVSNVTDTLGNAFDMDKNTKVSTALNAEATALTKIAQSNTKEMVLSFDGALDPTEAAKTTNYIIDGKTVQAAVYNYDATKKTSTVTLTLNEAPTQATTTSVTLKNLSGKAVTGTPSPVFTDSVAPQVKSAEAKIVAGVENDELVITFDSNDVSKSAFDAGVGTVTLKDSKGNSYLLAGNTTKYATNSFDNQTAADKVDSIKFTFASEGDDAVNLLASETYTVEVKGFVDASGNELVTTTSNVTFANDSDKVAPKAASETPFVVTSNTALTLTFDEVVNEATSKVRGNYVVEYSAKGDFTDAVTLQPTYLTTTTDTVVFNFSSALTLTEGSKVKVKFVNVEDLAGNKQTEEQTVESAAYVPSIVTP